MALQEYCLNGKIRIFRAAVLTKSLTMSDKIKILLADDHKSYTEGLLALFSNDDLLHFVGCVHDPKEIPDAVAATAPDVVLMDFSFGEGQPDGIEVSEQLLERWPGLRIVMLTSYDDIPIIRQATRKGLAGYLLKSRGKAELKAAIQAVHCGFEVVESGALKTVSEEGKRRKPSPADAHPLTERELEVALLIAEGLSSAQIAEKLFRSINTIDTHRKNIFSKIDVHNVVELMHWLRERNLI